MTVFVGTGERLAKLGWVEFILPAAYDDGGDAVAYDVGEGAALAHEFVDANEESEGLNRDGGDGGEDGGERDEARASDAGSAFGSNHGEKKDADHLPEGQMRVCYLRKEEHGESEIDVGTVGVKAVAGGKDQAHDGRRRAEALELLHHVRKDGFGRAGAEDDEEFVLDISDKAKDGEASEIRDGSENEDDENQAGGIERADELEEIGERGNAVAGDREGHAAESAEGGGAHDDSNDAEDSFGEEGDATSERFATGPQQRNSKARKNGDEQNLKNVSAGESVNESAWNNGEQEWDYAGFVDAAGVGGGRFGIERGKIDIEAGAGVKNCGDENADDESERGNDFEIEKGFDADAADFFEVGHGGNTLDDYAEDYRRDHHSNQGDEGVAERLEGHAGLWREIADQDADDNRDEHLNVKNGIPVLARRRWRVRGHAARSHVMKRLG